MSFGVDSLINVKLIDIFVQNKGIAFDFMLIILSSGGLKFLDMIENCL